MTFWPALGSYKYPERPKKALLGAPEVLGGPWRSSEGPRALIWSQLPLADPSGRAVSGLFKDLYGTPGAPKRARFGPKRAQKTLLGAPEVLGGPRGAIFGPNCPRLAPLGWTHGHHTL